MSGHKRATISVQQVDPRRLEEAAARLQAVEKDFQDIRQKINHLHHEQLQTGIQQLQDRQEHFNHALGYLDEHLQSIEYHTSQTLLDKTAQFNASLAAVETDLWENTSGMLEQQAKLIQAVLDESMIAQQDQFRRMRNSIARSRRDENYKQHLALQAFETACTMINSVDATYDHNRYLPGVIPQIYQDLEIAHQNLENGFFEAVLLASQQAYQRCSAARLEIENILLQKQLAMAATTAQAEEFSAQLNYARQVHAVDLDGNPLDETMDVEYWSWGAWRDMVKECQRYINLLKRSQDELELEQIAQIRQQLESQEHQLPQLISQARQNILSSQVRYNLAECIVQALQEQGFFLVESQYQGQDQRQPYQTVLKDYAGSEIIVQLAPQPDCPILHTIDLISEDAGIRTQHELRQRASALKNALQAYGLDISNFKSLPGTITNQPASPSIKKRSRLPLTQ